MLIGCSPPVAVGHRSTGRRSFAVVRWWVVRRSAVGRLRSSVGGSSVGCASSPVVVWSVVDRRLWLSVVGGRSVGSLFFVFWISSSFVGVRGAVGRRSASVVVGRSSVVRRWVFVGRRWVAFRCVGSRRWSTSVGRRSSSVVVGRLSIVVGGWSVVVSRGQVSSVVVGCVCVSLVGRLSIDCCW